MIQAGTKQGTGNPTYKLFTFFDSTYPPSFLSCSLYLESIVDVEGIVSAAPEKIKGCTQQDVEIQVKKASINALLMLTDLNC